VIFTAPGRTSDRTLRRTLARAAAIVVSATVATAGLAGVAAAAPGHGGPAARPASAAILGPNVIVFDPSMSTAEIQAKVDAIANQQVSNQFGTQRYALLFKPGTYGSVADPLNFQVGF